MRVRIAVSGRKLSRGKGERVTVWFELRARENLYCYAVAAGTILTAGDVKDSDLLVWIKTYFLEFRRA